MVPKPELRASVLDNANRQIRACRCDLAFYGHHPFRQPLYAAQRFHPVSEQKTASTGEVLVSGWTANIIILAAILIVSLVIASRGSGQ